VFPDFFSGGEAAFFGDDEGHGELDEFLFADAFRAFADEGGDADVDVLGEETLFELFEAAGEERELEIGEPFAEGAEDGWEVFALNGFGASDAESGGCAAAEGSFDFGEAGEEGFDEAVEGFAGGGELEGATVEEGGGEGVFELEDLGADGWLLDAVGDAACGGADATVAGDVVEEFEVMDVHGGEGDLRFEI